MTIYNYKTMDSYYSTNFNAQNNISTVENLKKGQHFIKHNTTMSVNHNNNTLQTTKTPT